MFLLVNQVKKRKRKGGTTNVPNNVHCGTRLAWVFDKAAKAHNQIILADEIFWQNKLQMFDKTSCTIFYFSQKTWSTDEEATNSVMIQPCLCTKQQTQYIS